MIRHFTATAFVLDSQGRTLLLWHKRLQRWMPPGGHVEPNEAPHETAKRECKEETGLTVDILGDVQEDLFSDNSEEGKMIPRPFFLLCEHIPACPERNEEAHEHMDFIYIARPVDESELLRRCEEESDDMRWFTKKEIEKLDASTEIFANVKRYLVEVLGDRI
jgi:8-oxo-dGTP pyrophosphatase MutT (NUDIX family)